MSTEEENTTKAKNSDSSEEKERTQIYEVGFNILPTVPEEKLPEEVFAIKSVIEDSKGTFISEDFPRQKVLAYKIYKEIDGKKKGFDQAFFGWVKFEVTPDSINSIKEKLEKNPNILRFILIKTVKEDTLARPENRFADNREGKESSNNSKQDNSGSSKSEGDEEESSDNKSSEEEIDKSIDKLVTDEDK